MKWAIQSTINITFFFPPFLSTVNLQTLYSFSPMTVKYTKLSYMRSYILPRFFLVFDTGKLGKSVDSTGKSEKVIRLRKVAKIYGPLYVSGKLPTYPSPKPTLTLTSRLGQNVGSREGQVGSFPKTYYLQTFTLWWWVVGGGGGYVPSPHHTNVCKISRLWQITFKLGNLTNLKTLFMSSGVDGFSLICPRQKLKKP